MTKGSYLQEGRNRIVACDGLCDPTADRGEIGLQSAVDHIILLVGGVK